MSSKRGTSCVSSPLKSKKTKLHDTETQKPGKVYCAWCRTEVKRHDERLTLDERFASLIQRHARRIVHKGCGEDLMQFCKRADCELGDLKSIKQLFDATLYSRNYGDCQTLDLDIDGVAITLPIVRDDDGGCNVYPLGLTKKNCHPHWTSDRRWSEMKKMARGRPMFEQILVARHTMQLPWGTAPPFRQHFSSHWKTVTILLHRSPSQ